LEFQAAQSTNAWIITSGFNMGVMKAVGDAVAVGQTYNWENMNMTHTLRCIGIAPWGYVERRSFFERKNSRVTYYMSSQIMHMELEFAYISCFTVDSYIKMLNVKKI